MSFEIVTDCCANLTPEIIEQYNIHVLDLQTIVDGSVYKNAEDDDPRNLAKFYRMMREGKIITTSLTPLKEVEVLFKKLLGDGKDVIFAGFSSALSANFTNMDSYLSMLQKDEYPDRKIYCFDTLAASLGQGLMVYHLAKKREQSLTIDEAYKWLKENVLNLAHWFTVDDLMFLERGGRVTKTMAIAGTMLNIKPVLHVDDLGRLVPVSKVRGRKKSLTALVDNMAETAINPSEQIIFIGHGDCVEDAEFVRDQIIERMGVKEFVIHCIHPVIGAHSGPGTVALFFIGTHR